MKIIKTSTWLRSWIYDATNGDIYTGHDHINIMPEIPGYEKKMMAGDLICGWWVRDYNNDVGTRIATDTVPQEYANKESPIAEKAQKAAMEYWKEHGLGETYATGEYCEDCDEYVSDLQSHKDNYHPEEYCEDCDKYYNPEYEDHSDPYCEECDEHVPDIDQHNKDYHFNPEPWMPKEGEKIEYEGREWSVWDVNSEGMKLHPWLPGGAAPAYPIAGMISITWDQYKQSLNTLPINHPNQGQMFDPERYGNWTEVPPPAIIHCVDLHDNRVFAKLCKDYITQESLLKKSARRSSYILGSEDYWTPQGDINDLSDAHLYTGEDPIGNDIAYNDPTESQPSDDQAPSDSQADDTRVLDIAKNPESAEYRWSYDGRQLHMWRVFSRYSYGPSHYDMFGSDGYTNHSQGRVYVSPMGKVGVLYWQISHPECEQVVNDWCMKTFDKMPDYTYRAYGPYAGEVRPRYNFPVVEVSSLPIKPSERWWERPGGTSPWDDYTPSRLKRKDYPAKPKTKLLELAPGPVDDDGESVNPNKNKRRKRTRNRKYRNRSFRNR